MNPSSLNEMPNLNLPPPNIEQNSIEQVLTNPNINRETIEQLPTSQNNVSPIQGAVSPTLAAPTPLANQPVSNNIIFQQLLSGYPMVAHDGNRIEEGWVIKMKQVINATKDDPYMQAKAVALSKADYIKKRYNKEIKLDNG
jgi:hypothetical protein